MQEQPPDNIAKAVRCGLGGPTSFHKEVGLPFVKELVEELGAEGFDENLEAFDIPAGVMPSREFKATNVFGVDDVIFIGVSIYLAEKVGSWALGRVCNSIYDGKIKPALKGLAGKLRKTKVWVPTPDRPVIIKLGTWYDSDKLFVLVIADIRSDDELDNVGQLVTEAQKSALEWVEHHGIPSPVLIYRIQGGLLTTTPVWSESAPER